MVEWTNQYMTTNGGTVDRETGVSTISDGGVYRDDADGVRDTTASELFEDLQEGNEADGPDVDFGDSADEIVADAEGHGHERFTDGGQAIAAGSELEDLLIPDREEGEEFHWVNTGDDGDDAAEAAAAVEDGSDATTDADPTDCETKESAEPEGTGGILGAVRSLFGRR